jgi:small subunit ribosomal protein S3|uniref:Small ribosomal subunit protein uS3m n=1 Tax=Chorisodontium aciphyllum TaxID=910423 RepID=A0A7D7D5E7_9BRYO|nr:ribosomal protein S3 [Chorisodontium aciphyllum]QMJ96186.1 ribosomal protein S3 [Chorisodontium aciphyllum]
MAQKINPISVRLNLNRSSDSSWFSDYYYEKLLYQDVNFRDYFDLIRPPTGKTFGFRLGKFIIHHFPKRTFIHVFFLDRLSRSRHTGLGAIQSVKLIRRIDDATKIQQNEVKIRRYGYDDRLPSMHEIDQLLRISGWMASKKSTSLRNDALLENDDRKMSEKSYAFSRFGSLRQISDVFPQTIFAAVRAPLNHLVMQYFFHLKNRIQFDPIVNIVSDLAARTIIERYMTEKAKKKEDSLKKRMRSILLNKSICSKKEGLTYMDKTAQGPYVEALRGSTHFIRLANEIGFARKNRPEISPNIQTAYSVWLFSEDINSGRTEMRSAEELLALRTALPSFARALTFPHQNALHCLRKQSLLRLRFQIHREQGVPLANNYIIKSTEPIRQPWSILDFGAPLISRDAEWRKVHSLFSRYYYWKKMQFFLSNQTKTNTLIRPVKIASVYQSASLIAQEISWKLEQKKSFRQICRSTFQEIEKCQYVKGIRICCSGRLNGAEIAKTECRKYGETSLHVFSDQIDYAKAQASTPYGILGVKVWVSYF